MKNRTSITRDPNAEFLDRPALAGLLGVRVSYVDDLVCRGQLPCVRLGHRTVRFRRSAIEEWLRSRTFDPSGEEDGR